MATLLQLNPALPERVHQYSWSQVPAQSAFAIYGMAELMVIDDVPWNADFSVIQRGLIAKRRMFKQPFHDGEIGQDVRKELDVLRSDVSWIQRVLYPQVTDKCFGSFRPMVSGPEPLHFDTYTDDPVLTAFVNISTQPRVYGIGRSLPGLVKDQPDLMREILQEWKVKNLSYHIRLRTVQGEAPLTGEIKHKIEFQPGAIWFFNAKTVSHELTYGAGAMGFSWAVPEGTVKTQRDIVAGLL